MVTVDFRPLSVFQWSMLGLRPTSKKCFKSNNFCVRFGLAVRVIRRNTFAQKHYSVLEKKTHLPD